MLNSLRLVLSGFFATTGIAHVRWPQGELPACGWPGSHEWLSTRPSPLDSVQLPLRAGIAKICYSRPSARGRRIYEDLVPFGRTWRTGANEPTLLYLTAPARIGDSVFASGRYVLLTVPGPRQWRVILNTTDETEPAKMFQSLKPVGMVVATVDSLQAPMEQFTITPLASSPTGFLLAWGPLGARVTVGSPP